MNRLHHMTRQEIVPRPIRWWVSALSHSKGVSKLYLFSSNNPSSIALISVGKKKSYYQHSKQARADQFINSEKRTQRNVRRVESAQGKVSYIVLSISSFFFKE